MSSSSTSSSSSGESERAWRGYFIRLVCTFGFLLAGTYAFIVVLDPFDVLPLSPSLDRKPVSSRPRYIYPGIARKARYDGCVVGASDVRLLRPSELNSYLGGAFASLAMNAATRYEQRAILDVFLRHHPRPKTIVVGLNGMWLDTPYTAQRHIYPWFPEWMYDANRWNDYLHHWNIYSLQNAWRQLFQLLGRREPRFEEDGYESYLTDNSAFDPDAVRARMAEADYAEVFEIPDGELGSCPPAVQDVVAMLRAIPVSTEKIVVLPPFFDAGRCDLRAFKRGLVEAAGPFENLRILDFAIESPITTTFGNWYDRAHYSREVASEICRHLAASRDPEFRSDAFRVLLRR
jgi:hypothetical protein